jgi:hypothetical protein
MREEVEVEVEVEKKKKKRKEEVSECVAEYRRIEGCEEERDSGLRRNFPGPSSVV